MGGHLIGKFPWNLFLLDYSRHAKIEAKPTADSHFSPVLVASYLAQENTQKMSLEKILPEWRMPSTCPLGCATHQLSTDKHCKMNLLHKI